LGGVPLLKQQGSQVGNLGFQFQRGFAGKRGLIKAYEGGHSLWYSELQKKNPRACKKKLGYGAGTGLPSNTYVFPFTRVKKKGRGTFLIPLLFSKLGGRVSILRNPGAWGLGPFRPGWLIVGPFGRGIGDDWPLGLLYPTGALWGEGGNISGYHCRFFPYGNCNLGK